MELIWSLLSIVVEHSRELVGKGELSNEDEVFLKEVAQERATLGEDTTPFDQKILMAGIALNMSEAIIERLLLKPSDIGLISLDHPILEGAFQNYINRSVGNNPRYLH